MKHPDNEDFKEWLHFLKKKHGVKYSDAGNQSGIGVTRLSNIRYDRTQATIEDFKKVVIAFPALRGRARELDINPNPKKLSDVEALNQEQADALAGSMLEEIRKAMASKDKRISYLESENQRLHDIITDHQSTITKLLDR
ncbi:hypothetical protein [Neolewinella antarctica]|uniref:HTH cro/C1-type domain-containing protein n=1 Tax=Neolewinella antarctica TaxID=442734 RepID=A0ABX0X6I1_9BACT|nr:hypothetical protein [Neolewinella antarctica]NJC24826.1 hypothetical protein [Neolewinella antarctica]